LAFLQKPELAFSQAAIFLATRKLSNDITFDYLCQPLFKNFRKFFRKAWRPAIQPFRACRKPSYINERLAFSSAANIQPPTSFQIIPSPKSFVNTFFETLKCFLWKACEPAFKPFRAFQNPSSPNRRWRS
jgi:hypothetical protein